MNINTIWCDLLVGELYRQGVRCFCLSSGARSGPLAMAVARHPGIDPVMHFDERASAFYALGHARATRWPAVWITTSGTAVANGLPAVVEAAQDGVPLIALTADRPPELRDNGSNQTIEQPGLFGSYARWFVDMPCPDRAILPTYVLTTAAHAMARATGSDQGPVHLNLMLRDPLGGDADGIDYGPYLQGVPQSDQPFTQLASVDQRLSAASADAIRANLESAHNGLIIVGRLRDADERAAAMRIAETLPWPLIADIGSGLRVGRRLKRQIVFGDQLLLKPQAAFQPDIILHLGGPVVSKRVLQWTAGCGGEHILVKSHPHRQDPLHAVRHVVEAELATVAEALAGLSAVSSHSLEHWQAADAKAESVVRSFVEPDGALDEIFIAASVSSTLPEGMGLFLASSMPVRDMDMYALPDGARLSVAANRGASGIDGTIATACGWAHGSQQPVLAVVGDLAFLHDLNALYFLKTSKQPVVVVVINNNGGGIFSFLPAARQTDVFETVFGTPHHMTFAAAASQFSLPYHQPGTRNKFKQVLADTLAQQQSAIIEVSTDRAANVKLHQDLQAQLMAAISVGA